jgi:D-beta-D-heptose 7-phosphate kinase/D-beta-D-heptose 1-phosphate adenosyltransferase
VNVGILGELIPVQDKIVKGKYQLYDIAVLKINRENCPVLPLGTECTIGDSVFSHGFSIDNPLEIFPKGFPMTSRLAGTTTTKDVSDMLVLENAEVNSGLSGAPAVDEKGTVIGILRIKYGDYALVTPIKYLFEICPELKPQSILTFFQELCEKYKKREKYILIIGDVMLDHRMKGKKAKFDKVEGHEVGEDFMLHGQSGEHKTPGGASNVACAFSKVSDVTLIGVISSDSSDYEGKTLKERCKENFTFDPVEIPGILTTTKIYFEYPDQQGKTGVVRFNREDSKLMEKKCLEYKDIVINKIKEAAKNSDCIVIKDHEKGFITADLVKKISEIANDNKIPLFVDPKYNWNKFNNVDIKAILPNIKEASFGLLREGDEPIEEIKEDEITRRQTDSKLFPGDYKKLVDKYPKCKNFIIKADIKGAFIASKDIDNGKKPEDILALPLNDREFETGIGCGDVFDAYAIIGILNRHTLEESILFANFAAGLRAKRSLGEVISPDEIKDMLETEPTHFKAYFEKNKEIIETRLKKRLET